jgi:hypothetical protein
MVSEAARPFASLSLAGRFSYVRRVAIVAAMIAAFFRLQWRPARDPARCRPHAGEQLQAVARRPGSAAQTRRAAARRRAPNDTGAARSSPPHVPPHDGPRGILHRRSPAEQRVYYLQFPNGNVFGYYSYLSYPRYIYHFYLGYEYVSDPSDGKRGAYLYDFASGHWWYTSPTYPFPYVYDFSLSAFPYYYPDTKNAGHYTTSPRYFL